MKTLTSLLLLATLATSAHAQGRHALHRPRMSMRPVIVSEHRLSTPTAQTEAPKVAPTVDEAKVSLPTEMAIPIAAMLGSAS